MTRVLASLSAPTSALADGFGRRVRGIDPDLGDEVDLLELEASLVEHAGFVAALGERVARVCECPPRLVRPLAASRPAGSRSPDAGFRLHPGVAAVGASAHGRGNRHRPRYDGGDRPAPPTAPGRVAVQPSQPRFGDRRTRAGTADRHAAGEARDSRARIRARVGKTQHGPRSFLARFPRRDAALCGAPARQRARRRQRVRRDRVVAGPRAEPRRVGIPVGARRPHGVGHRAAQGRIGAAVARVRPMDCAGAAIRGAHRFSDPARSASGVRSGAGEQSGLRDDALRARTVGHAAWRRH